MEIAKFPYVSTETFVARMRPWRIVQYPLFPPRNAIFASAHDVPPKAIKAQGNWRSACYQQYVVPDQVAHLDLAQSFRRFLFGCF